MRQLYRGQADRAAFAEALPRCTMPVCYNGDVTTPEELRALETQFPQLSGIMIGRGFIADPACCGGPAAGPVPPARNCGAIWTTCTMATRSCSAAPAVP